MRAELAKYQGPCRIVLGQRDGIISSSETNKKLAPGIAVHLLENAGHLPFLEEQNLSARLITESVRSSG